MLERTIVVAIHDGNYVLAVERGRRLWRIRAKRIVLATGALERPPVFRDNDLPGTMLAGAAAAYGDPDGVTAVSGGWSPRVHLWSQARGRLRWDDRIGAPVPDGETRGVECAGRATGEGLPGRAAVRAPGRRRGHGVRRPRARRHRGRRPPRRRRRAPLASST